MRIKHIGIAVAGLAVIAAAQASPVNGTGLVTPGVIFGSGNANGSFTGQTANNIEVGLRAKQRFPAANIFNYDGVNTYTFDTNLLTTNPANRSVFNFEWSVNVNQSGNGTGTLSGFIHRLGFDTDPTAGVSYIFIDPFNTPGYFDHALGTNATTSATKVLATSNADLLAIMGNFNVAQQSSNLGFGFAVDPDANGQYSFRYDVFALDDPNLTNALASAEILVNVVPSPATLPLAFAALGLMAVASRRRR